MEILTTIFSYFWYEVFFALLIIAVVYLARMKFHSFIPHDISDNVPQEFETYYQSSDQEFSDLGWIRLGTFRCTHPEEKNVIIARLFCSPDYNYFASLLQCKASDDFSTYLTEFGTELFPPAYVITNNNPYPSSVVYKNKFIFKFPSINSVKDLFKTHSEFCETARLESFSIKKQNIGCIEERIYEELKKDYDYQVKTGRMKKVDETTYTITLRGAILGVPMQVLHFLYSFLFGLFRPQKATLIKRLKKKLGKIQQQQLFGDQ